MTYRWKRAHDWLEEMGTPELYKQLVEAFVCDDNIQQLFQSGMEQDGFFQKLVECQFCGDKIAEDDLVECPRCNEKQCPCCYDDSLPRCNECEYFLDDLFETDRDEFDKQMTLEDERLEEIERCKR